MTIVWNDPVNLMSYVTWVLQKLFGYSKEKAEKLMLDVHHKGKAMVSVRRPRADGVRRVPAARVRAVGDGDARLVSMFRRDGAHCSARFSAEEVKVLRQVATEVVALLTDGFDRDDPVVERLFPDVYPDDPEATADLRQYTDGDLKTGEDRPGRRDPGRAARRPAAPTSRSTRSRPRRGCGRSTTSGSRSAPGWTCSDDTDLEDELDEAVLHDPTSARVGQLSLYAYLGLSAGIAARGA